MDTRLAMVADGRLDAVVLAAAGLARLGRSGEATELLDPLQVLPAPAQGALAVECRADDAALVALLAALHDEEAGLAVAAERALLATLEAGCTAPVAALAEVGEADPGEPGAVPGGRELWLRAVALAPDGSDAVRASATTPPARADRPVRPRPRPPSPLRPRPSPPPAPPPSPRPHGRADAALPAAVAVGRRLAREMVADGADTLLGAA